MVDRLKTLPSGRIDKRQYNFVPNMGQGRPLGAKNVVQKLTRKEAAKKHVEAGGMMPLEFMLSVLRDRRIIFGHGKRHRKEYEISWEDKKWAAQQLLPCFTPKLAHTTLEASVKVYALPPDALKHLTDEELEVMERAMKKLNGNYTESAKLIEGQVLDDEITQLANEYERELNGDTEDDEE